MKALRSFPLGSPVVLMASQHISDLLSGATEDSFQQALVDFVTLLLTGSIDKEVRAIVFGGRLLALSKKGGGVRPITLGYTLRRLAAKCANNHVTGERDKTLQPQQLGVGVAGGAEAAVHAVHRLVSNMPDNNVIVKLDCSNAFNCIVRQGSVRLALKFAAALAATVTVIA